MYEHCTFCFANTIASNLEKGLETSHKNSREHNRTIHPALRLIYIYMHLQKSVRAACNNLATVQPYNLPTARSNQPHLCGVNQAAPQPEYTSEFGERVDEVCGSVWGCFTRILVAEASTYSYTYALYHT